ncbi:hypothetical protein ACSBR2_036604 [Camellia fascicularis]
MQRYAFHNEPPGGVDGSTGKKQRLLKIFEGWCDNVIDLLLATCVGDFLTTLPLSDSAGEHW